MMSQTQALATLEREDPDAVGDVKVALAWLAGEEGLGCISLLRLQEFLWYVLPLKWPDNGQRVAAVLGRVLDLAGLDRYARLCASAETSAVIGAYALGRDEGIAAYSRAVAASHVPPPDTDLLAWGSVMGPQERAAYDACAAAVELSFAAGEMRPGVRGWRTGRTALVNRWLTMPAGPAQDGTAQDGTGQTTWLSRISAERIDAWAYGAGEAQSSQSQSSQSQPGQFQPGQPESSRPRPGLPSGQRRRMARAVIPRLLEPSPVPVDPLPTLGWMLGHATSGLRLTARHYIAPALVTEAADLFGWRGPQSSRACQELDVFPLHTLRGMAQHEMGAVRRSRTSLVLTRTGKLMTADPATMWHIGTAALIGADEGPRPSFAVAVREAALLTISSGGPDGLHELTRVLTSVHDAEGWTARAGLDQAVGNELYALRHRLWALDLLAPSRPDRLALSEAGTAAALSALLARALRPRHHAGI